jgi:hypothetical protein
MIRPEEIEIFVKEFIFIKNLEDFRQEFVPNAIKYLDFIS